MHGHWSAVRCVIDGMPPHSLVLRVASVLPADGPVQPGPEQRTLAPPSTPTAGRTSTLLLTDGWHGISAALDSDLDALVRKGSIRAGTTLLVCAATLEATVPPRLSLYYNSTFRCAAAAFVHRSAAEPAVQCLTYSTVSMMLASLVSTLLTTLGVQ